MAQPGAGLDLDSWVQLMQSLTRIVRGAYWQVGQQFHFDTIVLGWVCVRTVPVLGTLVGCDGCGWIMVRRAGW
jgi:hypothetical protein